MKIALCQHNPIPGDVRGNCEQLRELIDIANHQEADLILCSETATTGYLVRDLMYRRRMIETNLRYTNELAAYTAHLRPNTTLIFGYQGWNTSGRGKPFRNMAAICRNGAMIGSYAKRLLPFYDVFDEGRYYEPGEDSFVFDCGGVKWGVLICEDGWSADKGETAAYYACSPVDEYRAQGVNNFVWINASPFVRGKIEKRLKIAQQMSQNGIVAYCNHFGGQDSLVFDGHSFVFNEGTLIDWNGNQDRPSVWVVESGASRSVPPTEDLKKMLVLGTRDYARKCGFTQAAVLSSGGVDSAVVLSIACEALGAENVTGIRAPTTISSADASDDALALHQAWGCKDQLVTIQHEAMLEHLNKSFGFDPQSETYNSVAYENSQPRLRALSAMHFCNVTGALLLSTGNKTEMATGYFTYGGDPTGGFDPLVDCYKGEVYEVGRQFPQIPKHILEKRPTADLRPGQFDQETLLPYPILDRIVEAYIEDYVVTYEDFLVWARTAVPSVLSQGLLDFQLDAANYARMVGKIDRAEWKRQQVGPGVKVHRVSFGIGRRNPIAARG